MAVNGLYFQTRSSDIMGGGKVGFCFKDLKRLSIEIPDTDMLKSVSVAHIADFYSLWVFQVWPYFNVSTYVALMVLNSSFNSVTVSYSVFCLVHASFFYCSFTELINAELFSLLTSILATAADVWL